MEIYNNDPVIKKNIYAEKKERKDKISSRDKSADSELIGGETKLLPEEIKELQAKVQKAILKSEAIIGGIENFRSLADRARDTDAKEQILQDVVARTVQDSEKVLARHKQVLEAYLYYGDTVPMEKLIRAEKENIRSNSSELGKNAVKEQNFISLGSTLEGQDPEELLRAVIRQLKEQGEPEIHLPHNRVLDLLGE